MRRNINLKYNPELPRKQAYFRQPSFPEFVAMLSAGPEGDARFAKYKNNLHWMPYHETTKPCDVRYDYIIKLETFNEDLKPILPLLSSEEKPVSYFESILRQPINKNYKENFTNCYIPKEVLELTYGQRLALKKRYQRDFTLFGYDFDAVTGEVIYNT